VFNTSVTFALILNDVSDFIVGMHCVVAPATIFQRFSLPVGERITSDGVKQRGDATGVAL
jgi:hypothetical protein